MNELKSCPFCGSDGVIHVRERPAQYARYKKDIPKGSRVLREVKYPSGNTYIEYRRSAYIPQCSKSDCIGRTQKLYDTKEAAIKAWNRRVEGGKA
jgi:ribosomal protein L34E